MRGLRSGRGATVVLTTHYLEEADALCDRVLIIDAGRVVAADTPDALKRRVSGDVVTLDLSEEAALARAEQELAGLPDVRDVHAEHHNVRLTVDEGERTVLALVRRLDDAGIDVGGFSVMRPSLDDVFLTLTGRSLRDAEHAPTADHTDAPADPLPVGGGDRHA
ncbi:DUF4162 domain-containing protein [Egibacter rhizosphaerae]|uniref:ATP-binding protein DrrA1-3 family domain-containing protein n=1 Tax=Egibacter rhizosphaerae TaxID=1670831 RepID=UPI00197AFCB3|nr:DUF4162 domain-containing protein [Egibacter rhizosphaerae]